MATKTEIENILAAYERANNRGSVKEAGRLIAPLVRTLVDFVENPGVQFAPTVEVVETEDGRKQFFVDVGNLAAEKVTGFLDEVVAAFTPAPAPCEPCTPTEENPNGVAEPAILNEEGVPVTAEGVNLEKLQDEQALGVATEETAEEAPAEEAAPEVAEETAEEKPAKKAAKPKGE